MRVGVASLLVMLLVPAGAVGSTTRAATITFPFAKPVCKPPRMCPVPVVPPPAFASRCYSSSHTTSTGLRVGHVSGRTWTVAGHFATAALTVTWHGTYTAVNGAYSGQGTGTWHTTRRPAACGSAVAAGQLAIVWSPGANDAIAVAHLRLLSF